MTRTSIFLLAVFLAACGAEEPPPPPEPAEGRAETRAIRSTQEVGVGGEAIADKLDEALDKNDENVEEVEQEAAEPPD